MNDRIIELSRCPVHISVDNGLLTLDIKGEGRVQVPPNEIAAVVAAHYAVTFTRESVALLADSGAQVVVCDKRGLPAAMLFPLRGFHQPATRLALQAAVKRPVHKRLWRQVVRSKVRAQGAMLFKLSGSDGGLIAMAAEAKSGDTTNVEGQAVRIYWRRLFGEEFRRDPEGFDQNRFLNYGYGVLRAVTCRAICAAGLHPGLGLHHHHRANPFCLADDLMEPFRPLVDQIAFELWNEQMGMADLTPELKKRLLGVLTIRLNLKGEKRVLFDILTRLALSLAGVIEGRRKTLVLPEWGGGSANSISNTKARTGGAIRRRRASHGGDGTPPSRTRKPFQPPSGYQAMWLFAMFDLPVKTRVQRREYTRFRKSLLREGFSQLQFSVYARYCMSEEHSVAYSDRIRNFLPPEGQVRMLAVTERQFGKQKIYLGPKEKPAEPAPVQLMMF